MSKVINYLNKQPVTFYLFIVCLIGLLVYFPVLSNQLVWDDEEQVIANLAIQNLKNIPSFFTSSTFNSGGASLMGGLYYKPIMPAIFALVYSIFKLNPVGYHSVQLMFHLANSCLVFILFRRFFPSSFLSLFLSLVFLLHPVNVESVAYVSATQEVLFFFFGLLALLLASKTSTQPAKNSIGQTVNQLLSILFLLMAFLSKETGLVFLPIIFVYLLLFNDKFRVFWWSTLSVLPVTVYLVLRLVIAKVPFQQSPIVPIAAANFHERLQTIPLIIFSYLKLISFPKDLAIAQHFVIKSIGISNFYLPLLVLTIGFWGLLLIVFRQRNKIAWFFFLWTMISLLPLIQIFPLDMTIADRWLYLPLVGVIGLMASLANNFQSLAGNSPPSTHNWRFRNFKFLIFNISPKFNFSLELVLLAILLVLFFFRTHLRLHNWHTGLSLYSHDIQLNPDAFDLNNNYGVELFRAGEIEKAIGYFQKSAELAPNWWTPFNNIGVYYQRHDDLTKAREYYQKSIDRGNYYLAYENLAQIIYQTESKENADKFVTNALIKFPYNQNLLLIKSLLDSNRAPNQLNQPIN